MAKGAALRSASRRILWTSLIAAALMGAAGAFAVGYAGALQESIANPHSAAAERIAGLEGIDALLGHDGFLKTYRGFLLSGESNAGRALQEMSADADRLLGVLARSAGDAAARGSTQRLNAFSAIFRRAAAVTGARPSLPELEGVYRRLHGEITESAKATSYAQVRALSLAVTWAHAALVAALSLLATTLFALAWFLREKLIGPLETLRRSIAHGAADEPIWGTERGDEIGAVARAAEKLRLAAGDRMQNAYGASLASLAESVAELRIELGRVSFSAGHARARVEEASTHVAKASHAAVEAAGLARQGAARLAERTENSLDAHQRMEAELAGLGQTVRRLSDNVARLERTASAPTAGEDEAMAVMREALDMDAALRSAGAIRMMRVRGGASTPPAPPMPPAFRRG